MEYDDLVNSINTGLKTTKIYDDAFGPKPGFDLQEVNAWTYWQGLGVRRPRIMVLGQDWGSIQKGKAYFNAIDDMLRTDTLPDKVEYFKYVPKIEEGGRDFVTDLNLAAYLKYLGKYDDVLHVRYDDLFFTNLLPGYRIDSKSTGGFKAVWVTKQVKEDFIKLLDILQPQVVICLGRNTFTQAAQIMGKKGVLKGKNWNDFLNQETEPIEVKTEVGNITHLFAVAHPGYFGMLNRSKEDNEKNWKNLKKWLEANPRFSDKR